MQVTLYLNISKLRAAAVRLQCGMTNNDAGRSQRPRSYAFLMPTLH